MTTSIGSPPRLWQFFGWAVLGVLAPTPILAAFTPFGLLVLPVMGGLGTFLGLRASNNWSPVGAGMGLAVPFAYLGALNWNGPGNVCSSSGSGITCEQEWNPAPFLGIAALLALGSIGVFVWARGQSRHRRLAQR